jgi:hypothetical protein
MQWSGPATASALFNYLKETTDMSNLWRAHLIGFGVSAILMASTQCIAAPAAAPHDGAKRHASVPSAFRELLELSLNEKVGLTFIMNGHSLPAIVTKIGDDGTVEGRSQEYGRIVIRLRRVNAIAKQ